MYSVIVCGKIIEIPFQCVENIPMIQMLYESFDKKITIGSDSDSEQCVQITQINTDFLTLLIRLLEINEISDGKILRRNIDLSYKGSHQEFSKSLKYLGMNDMHKTMYPLILTHQKQFSNFICEYIDKDQKINIYNYGSIFQSIHIFKNNKWILCIKNNNLNVDEIINKLISNIIIKYKFLINIDLKFTNLTNNNIMKNAHIEIIRILSHGLNTKKRIGFDNGIYDLETFTFRQGQADDYVSNSCNYCFSPKHTDKFPLLMLYLQSLLPDETIRLQLLKKITESFFCQNEKKIKPLIIVGDCNSGKSLFIHLLTITFGDYFGIFNNYGHLKHYSSCFGRMLLHCLDNDSLDSIIKNNNMKNIVFNQLIVFVGNNVDQLVEYFGKKKVCVIEFPNKFIDNPLIYKKVEEWKIDFMLLIIETYKTMNQNNEFLL